MAFLQKTWKDRVAEYINRRVLTKEDGTTELVSVERSEGTISQEGDAFSAANMNDLEQRIANEFSEQNKNLNMRYNPETDMIEILYDGVWKEFQKANMADFKIYTNGYQNIALTTDYSTNWDRSQDSVQLLGEYIKFSANANSAALIGTNKSIDVSKFSKICVEYSTGSNSTKQIKTVDISSLSGDRYIWVCLVDYNGKLFSIGTNTSKKHDGSLVEFSTNAVTYVYRIWLE